MIYTIKLEAKFARNGEAFLGTIPAGRILKSEPVVEDGKMLWMIEVETDPGPSPFREYYLDLPGRPHRQP